MTTRKLGNISLKDFRTFLKKIGCVCSSIEGGHEKWVREGLKRPVVLQSHIEPVPEFIVKNTLRNLGLSKEDYFNVMGK